MFANVSPCASHADETLCSLQFAARVDNVQIGAAKKKVDPKLGAKLKRATEALRSAKTALAAKEAAVAKLAAKNEALGKAVAEAQGEAQSEKARSATLTAKLLKTKENAAKQISAKESRASKVRRGAHADNPRLRRYR